MISPPGSCAKRRERARLRIALAAACVMLAACADFKLFVANIAAAGGPFMRTDNIAYGSARRQRLDVYRPKQQPATGPQAAPAAGAGVGLPVVVFFHGGTWATESKDDYRFVGATLAEHGWLGIVPSYRVYPQVEFPAFVEDAALAIAWTEKHAAEYGGDPRRIFVLGHSSGAHIALLVALDPRYLTSAGAGADAIRGVIGLSGPYDFLPFASARIARVFEHARDPLDTQPIHFARGDAPPVLLLHGTADAMVPAANSQKLAESM
jgi:acetyl esterase/lipase